MPPVGELPVVTQTCVALAVMEVTCPLTKPGRSTTFCIPADERVET